MEDVDVPTLLNLGVSFAIAGDVDRARYHLEEAIRRRPWLPQAWFELAQLPDFLPDEATLEHMEQIPSKSELTGDMDPAWRFMMARTYDRLGRYEEAWARYVDANESLSRARPYDPTVDVTHREAVPQVMTAEFFAERAHVGVDSRVPIFVFGLPRSGTTLVEQILTSHPDVRAGGERETALRAAVAVLHTVEDAPSYIHAAPSLTDERWRDIATSALDDYVEAAGSAARLTDKAPGNFRHIGLLAVLFPNATFVHVHRDPRDVAVSLYAHMFTTGHRYSSDFRSIAGEWADERDHIAHWEATAPVHIHHVRYEQLVEDLEAATRDLLAASHLDWDERCLAFHENPRSVSTASRWAVRRPLYRDAIGGWRRFEPEVGALVDELEAAGARFDEDVSSGL